MFCDLTEIEDKSCNNMSLNNLRRNSFLAIQANKFNSQVNKNINIVNNQTEISLLFFSEKNINILQKRIKEQLYFRTNRKYILTEDQDKNSLLLVMKNIYSEHSNLSIINAQIEKLNNEVIEFIMPDIITGVKQYGGYIDKINSPLKPLNRPINVNNKGRKQLRSVTTIWN